MPIGCNDYKDENININVIGSWYYLNQDSIYTEIYIDSSKIMSFSEKTLYMGPYKYTISNNHISFNDLYYKIEPTSCKSMIWENSEYEMNMNRIDSFSFDFSRIKDDANPFYLRKYVYLVNHGLMTTEEALKLLCGKVDIYNNKYIEEDLKINH